MAGLACNVQTIVFDYAGDHAGRHDCRVSPVRFLLLVQFHSKHDCCFGHDLGWSGGCFYGRTAQLLHARLVHVTGAQTAGTLVRSQNELRQSPARYLDNAYTQHSRRSSDASGEHVRRAVANCIAYFHDSLAADSAVYHMVDLCGKHHLAVPGV